MFAEGGKIIERVAHGHPRIKRDGVWHIGDSRFHGNFIALRIESEYAHGTGHRAQQIEQTFYRGGFPRAVASKKSVATTGQHFEAEAIHGVLLAVTMMEIFDFDDGSFVGHNFPWFIYSSRWRKFCAR